jgi:SulP family sulfate permease
VKRYFPFLDLKEYRPDWLVGDLSAGFALIFLAVPQGVAYAMIAGLPPASGLYAAAIPTIVGSLLRSSRHVVTGPVNAMSLLVGTTIAPIALATGAGVGEVALALALVLGLMQVTAGLLRLGVLVDYISIPVLRGFITGAGVLIAVGQLPNVTGTQRSTGNLLHMLDVWVRDLGNTKPIAVAFALGTVLLVVGLRRLDRRIPAAIIAMVGGIAVGQLFGFHGRGLRVVADIAPVPLGLPPFTLPSLSVVPSVLSAAVACAVLALGESSSVARAIASRSGQQLDMNAEFRGEGLANVATAFSGGYPVTGSLSRSVLNEKSGAKSRLAATLSGVMMLVVLFVLGPLVDQTPIASLAGLLLVVAADVIDVPRIRAILGGATSDRLVFAVTLLGAWVLPLDTAIYFGVGLSLILFLRQARLLKMHELAIGEKGRFREVDSPWEDPARTCTAIRIMNLTGSLFFAVAGELKSALETLVGDRRVRVVVLRLRQSHDLDVTTASALEPVAERLRAEGRSLLLVGLPPQMMDLLAQTGIAHRLGSENLFAIADRQFSALELALRRALELAGEHGCGDSCPLREYLSKHTVSVLKARTI